MILRKTISANCYLIASYDAVHAKQQVFPGELKKKNMTKIKIEKDK